MVKVTDWLLYFSMHAFDPHPNTYLLLVVRASSLVGRLLSLLASLCSLFI